MDKLEDLRDWLMSRIDGSEETRGEDSLISSFINQIDAQDAELADLKQRLLPQFAGRTQRAEHERDALLEQLIAARSATAATVDHGYDRTASLAEGRYVCTCGACSRPDAREPAPTGCGAIFKESEGWSCDCERAHPAPCKANASPTTREPQK